MGNGDFINYPFMPMAQGAADIGSCSRQVADLQVQLQTAMQALLAAWQSQAASPQLQQVQQVWTQSNEAINNVLGRRGGALDDAWLRMKQADQSAANALEV
ncbi:WXG100 family type VII secretion target [Kribbella catacumbae]|uniref:WXG100 family type VII secretion target n=1 Tax=Kribbella catacumbae TaxID=460086 RepID=UPI00036EA49B|nr:WXG100 family type VII secretion target [Kribbella catacumbae]